MQSSFVLSIRRLCHMCINQQKQAGALFEFSDHDPLQPPQVCKIMPGQHRKLPYLTHIGNTADMLNRP